MRTTLGVHRLLAYKYSPGYVAMAGIPSLSCASTTLHRMVLLVFATKKVRIVYLSQVGKVDL